MRVAHTPFGEVLTAMITPFTDDGAVDYGQADALARFLVTHGSDGILVTGTTGESPTMSDEEKLALLKTVIDAVGPKAHVVAGTGTYDTAHSVEMSRRAAEVGADAILAVTPYYSKPPQRGLHAHFVAIADATDLPMMVYNIPGRTARLIEVDTLVSLAGHPRIVATKDAVDDLGYTRKFIEVMPDDFAVYAGSDAFTLGAVQMGGSGVVSVASHLVGTQIKSMIQAAKAGDPEAERLHELMLPLFEALFIEPNPMPLKAALNEVWGPVGDPRLPLVPAERSVTEQVVEALRQVQQA